MVSKINIFDKNLNILEIISNQKSSQAFQKEIPKGAMFVKITDTFCPLQQKMA